jgi:monoamine oxidase
VSELFTTPRYSREQSRELSQKHSPKDRDVLDLGEGVEDTDVVVIGAGIAGLMVATRLIEAGLRCRVLERHNRVGGRLLTHRESDHSTDNNTDHGTDNSTDHYTDNNNHGHFDLGATWYWPGESRVAALIKELGVPTHAHH